MSRPFSGGLNAGRLNQKLVFQFKTTTVNAIGQSVFTWADSFEEWGEVQRNSETSCRFIVRYRLTATSVEHPEAERISAENTRILHDESVWTVINSIPDSKHTMLMIDCDFSAKVEVTHLLSTEKEFIDGLPTIATPE